MLQKRPPFNLQSMIMSPYGLMIGMCLSSIGYKLSSTTKLHLQRLLFTPTCFHTRCSALLVAKKTSTSAVGTALVQDVFMHLQLQVHDFLSLCPFMLLSAVLHDDATCIAGFMIFALFIMPMLKVDPEEYKGLMAEKTQSQDAISANSHNDAARSNQQRLQS